MYFFLSELTPQKAISKSTVRTVNALANRNKVSRTRLNLIIKLL